MCLLARCGRLFRERIKQDDSYFIGKIMSNFSLILDFLAIRFCCHNIRTKPQKLLYPIRFIGLDKRKGLNVRIQLTPIWYFLSISSCVITIILFLLT
jgi:hypothetical protein